MSSELSSLLGTYSDLRSDLPVKDNLKKSTNIFLLEKSDKVEVRGGSSTSVESIPNSVLLFLGSLSSFSLPPCCVEIYSGEAVIFCLNLLSWFRFQSLHLYGHFSWVIDL